MGSLNLGICIICVGISSFRFYFCEVLANTEDTVFVARCLEIIYCAKSKE